MWIMASDQMPRLPPMQPEPARPDPRPVFVLEPDIFFLTERPGFLWKETNIAKFHFNQDARTTALWNRQSLGVFFTSYCFHVFHSLGEMITLNKNGLHPLLIAPTKINVSFFKKQQKPTSKQMVIKTRQNYSCFQSQKSLRETRIGNYQDTR